MSKLSVSVFLAVACLSIRPSIGQLPNPVLTDVYVRGARLGSQQEVTVAGRDLDEATDLVFSHPGIRATAKMLAATEFEPERAATNQFRIDVAENVPPGIYEVRCVGRFGTSTPLSFLIHDGKHVVESSNNHTIEDAVSADLPCVAFGRADTNQADFYRFQARQGETISFECLTADIDSDLEPVLSVLTKTGKPLKRSSSVHDTTLTLVIPEDGDYFVAVHDTIFRGGNTYAYALRMTNRPVVDFVLPSAGMAGEISTFRFYGRNFTSGDASPYSFFGFPLKSFSRRLYVPTVEELVATHSNVGGFRTPAFRYSQLPGAPAGGEVAIGLAMAPVVAEQEPNDRQHPQHVQLPVEYCGNFYPRRDQDWIRFSASKGQVLSVEVHDAPHGIEVDPAVYLWQVQTNADGVDTFVNKNVTDDTKLDAARYNRRIPRALDYSGSNPSVRFTVPEDGDYCVSVRDLYGNARNDPRSVYRLVVRPAEPTFHLVAWTQRFRNENNNKRVERASLALYPGESRELLVDVVREAGFNGAVVLRATNLPSGVICPEVHVAPEQTEAALVFTADRNVSPSHRTVSVLGAAVIDGKTVAKLATFGRITTDVGNVAAERPARKPAAMVVVSTKATSEKAPVVAAIDNQRVWKSSVGGTLKIPVKIEHNATLKGDLKLNSIELPGEIKPKEIVLKPDTKEAVLEIPLNNPKVKPGRYTLFLTGQVAANVTRNQAAIAQAEKRLNDFSKQLESWKTELTTAQAKHDELAKQLAALQSDKVASNEKTQSVQQDAEAAKQSISQLNSKVQRAEAFRKTLEERLNNVKKQNGPRDVQVVVTSSPVTIEVLRSPIHVTSVPARVDVPKENTDVPVELSVERRFGFQGPIEVIAKPPEGHPPIAVTPIPADQTKTIAKVSITPTTPPGTYEYPVELKMKFGDVEIKDLAKLIVHVNEQPTTKSN